MCWLRGQRTAFPCHTDLSHRDLTPADGPFVPAVFGHEGTGGEHRHLRHRIGWVERTDGSKGTIEVLALGEHDFERVQRCAEGQRLTSPVLAGLSLDTNEVFRP